MCLERVGAKEKGGFGHRDSKRVGTRTETAKGEVPRDGGLAVWEGPPRRGTVETGKGEDWPRLLRKADGEGYTGSVGVWLKKGEAHS